MVFGAALAIIYQISLHGSAFDARDMSWGEAASQSGCKPNREWLYPIHKRPLLKGEFGCAVSHLTLWHKIAGSGLNGIILEEDAVFDSINPNEIDAKLKMYDSVWLGYRWNDLGYWYNCHAYAITPKIAWELCQGFQDAIIPVDEWVPRKLNNKNNYFYDTERVKQIPRAIRPSTIEDTEMLEGKDTDFRIVTVATEPEKMWALEKSAAKYGAEVLNLGKEHPWRDPMTGLAGMPKIQLVNEYLATIPSDAIVLFMDGYDTFFADSPSVVLERFYQMDADIVFGAEAECWPVPEMAHLWPETGTPYKYLNSGLYIGRADALHDFISQAQDTVAHKDDQLHCQNRYLDNKTEWNVKLDIEAYIFQNHDTDIKIFEDQLWNDKTNCCGCIYHGNGGDYEKQFFITTAQRFGYVKEHIEKPVQSPYYLTLEYEVVGPEMIATDFLTDVQCDYLINKSESYGNWGSMDGDKFPAQEIRLKQIGLWHEYERLWHEKLGKISEKYWKPMAHIGLRDAFTMKYTPETQNSLALHTDASLVTGSVKLNEDYEGGELIFPRQNFSNINMPRGCCLIWPSEVTHGHAVNEIISGTKYSLTMWTSRYPGDVNG